MPEKNGESVERLRPEQFGPEAEEVDEANLVLKCPCGLTYHNRGAYRKHLKQCPYGKGTAKRRAAGESPLEENPPPEPSGSKPNAEPAEGEGRTGEGVDEYSYPGMGPSRLVAVLRNHRYSSSESARIGRSFSNAHWAWESILQLVYFLQTMQVPYQTAQAIASEYFGVPPGQQPGGMPGMPGMMPGMPGMPPQYPPYGAPYGMPSPYYPFPPNPYNPFQSPFPHNPYASYPFPPSAPPAPAKEAPQDGAAQAAITALGTMANTALEKSMTPSGDSGMGALMEQFTKRMEDKVDTMKLVQQFQDQVHETVDTIKNAQIEEMKQREAGLMARIAEIERRNPIQEWQAWRSAVGDYAKEMGYAAPGSEGIYGAIGKGFEQVNETLRTGIGAVAGRGQKDKSLDDRRKMAEAALQEDRVLQRALEAVRRATAMEAAKGARRVPEASAAQGEPPAPPAPEPSGAESSTENSNVEPLTESRPPPRMATKGAERGMRVSRRTSGKGK